MLPLSFKEFLDFYEFETAVTIEEKFQRYLQFGGMPILRVYRFHEARSNQALEGIYATVVLRDVLQRNNQADQNTLQNQVAESMQAPETRERELRPLQMISDNYEKIVLSNH